MVEGGAGIVTSLLRARLVDRLVVCIAPMILGTGLDAVGDLGLEDLAKALRFRPPRFGSWPDIVLRQVERTKATRAGMRASGA